MKNSPEYEASRWMKQALADFDTGEYLIQGEKYYLACFTFQQAAEKGLKAFLYAQGEHLVIGHSVHNLCLECAKYEKEFARLCNEISGLDGYYIPTRYPNGLPDSTPAEVYTPLEAEMTRQLCTKTLEFVRKLLPNFSH